MVMGILGGFSGTVGTVVGSVNKNGDDIIRVKSKRKSTSNTEGQVNQRTKFGLVTQFMQPLNPLVRIGCKGVSGNAMTPYNYACKHALSNAISGTAPDFELDFSNVQLSFGDLSRVSMASATLVNRVVNFVWDDNSVSTKGNSIDNAVMLVYNVDAGELSFAMDTAMRATKHGSLALPYAEVGDRLLFYLFFQSATDPLMVSSSQYLGTVLAE